MRCAPAPTSSASPNAPNSGLRPRRAIGIHQPAPDPRRAPAFAGTIWVQQGSRPLADDADDVLRGAAVLAARIMSRLAATPSTHAVRVQELLGLRAGQGDDIPFAELARELGIVADGRAAVVGVDCVTDVPARLADVLALSASAFRPDAQVAARGSRVYVLFPHTGRAASVTSWIRGTIGALHTELGLELRAVIATPATGLSAVAAARAEVDRVLDSAERHPGAIGGQVTSLAEARTTVVLDEIVTMVAADERLIDPRVRELREHDAVLADTLRAYLDGFGDIGAAAQRLHVHPNTVRYRVRRIEETLATSLADPDVRLLLSLSLRATERTPYVLVESRSGAFDVPSWDRRRGGGGTGDGARTRASNGITRIQRRCDAAVLPVGSRVLHREALRLAHRPDRRPRCRAEDVH